jgi:spore germination cell wall hydrolase CwlJ-like protein
MCIAATLKNETSFASMKNARAVYDVIRTRMDKTGQSACKVVLANKQFSGMTMKKVKEIDKNSLTQTVRVFNMAPVCKRCEFFHAEWVKPVWRKQMVLAKRLDGHLFYRTKERV